MLVNDVYDKGELPVNQDNKQKLLEILRAFPADEPTRKRFITEMMGWSSKFGDQETGDPELHDAVGALYATGMCHARLCGYPCQRIHVSAG